MAKKAELLAEAKKLKLEVTEKNTIAEIEAAIAGAGKEEAKPVETTEKTAAKAGKRSVKGIAEAEEKQAKIERQHTDEPEEAEKKPKSAVKPARSRLERRGRKYREAAKLIEKDTSYPLAKATELAISTSTTKFDASVEIHIKLNVDPKQADQNIRDTVVLPAGTGKTIRIAVLAEADDAKTAKSAGADIAGDEALLADIGKGKLDFDVLIATPEMMAKLGQHAKTLGPKGLMPNPKSGTVTKDVAKAVSEAKGGKVEYRVDDSGIIHAAIGKVSFGKDKVLQNIQAFTASVKGNKPSSIKGTYVTSVYLTTSMGPSIAVDSSEV